ncbi:hypothetical protein ACI2T3_23000 [Ralstonia nicotianae]
MGVATSQAHKMPRPITSEACRHSRMLVRFLCITTITFEPVKRLLAVMHLGKQRRDNTCILLFRLQTCATVTPN